MSDSLFSPKKRAPRAPRARKEVAPKPVRIYSLSQRQADWLRDAENTKGGVYVPIGSGGPEPDQLVEAGLATYREVRQTSDTPNPYSKSGKSEWTDLYLVPTEAGRAMRKAHSR
jgi:hypothetical protein